MPVEESSTVALLDRSEIGPDDLRLIERVVRVVRLLQQEHNLQGPRSPKDLQSGSPHLGLPALSSSEQDLASLAVVDDPAVRKALGDVNQPTTRNICSESNEGAVQTNDDGEFYDMDDSWDLGKNLAAGGVAVASDRSPASHSKRRKIDGPVLVQEDSALEEDDEPPELAEKFDTLQSQIPATITFSLTEKHVVENTPHGKCRAEPKAVILDRAVRYVNHLVELCELFESEYQGLQRSLFQLVQG